MDVNLLASASLAKYPGTSQALRRLLVVDDEETDRLTVRRYVLQAGYATSVDEAATGAETLRQMATTTYDCILLDFYLPGEDTFALLSTLREIAPATPVVIFTGHGDEEIAVELMKAGAADYLPKASLSPERIESSLRHALAISREEAERRRAEGERALLLEREQQARADAERATERMAALQSVTAALARTLSPKEVASVVTEQGAAALRANAAAVFVLDVDGTVLEAIHDFGYPEEIRHAYPRLPLSAHMPLPDAIRAGEPIFYESASAFLNDYPFLAEYLGPDRYGSHALVPLILDGTVRGGLRFSFAGRKVFDDQDRALVTALAQQCMQALERARLFAAEQAARQQLQQYCAMVAHDLSQPLTTISGRAHLIRHALPTMATRARSHLDAIDAAQARMQRLVSDLRDASIIGAGQMTINAEPIDLAQALRRMVADQRAVDASHTVSFDGPSNLEVRCDARRLEQLVTNLVSNAVKYSAPGTRVRVALVDTATEAIIRVEDEGPGISPEEQLTLFQPFSRAMDWTTRTEGMGLGLYICKGIADAHRGRIWVESEPGKGSVFAVALPLVTNTNDPEPSPDPTAAT